MERLDKILAGTGRWSRSEAKELIRAGRVRWAGEVVRRPETKVNREDIEVDGISLSAEKLVYILLHKPAGVVSATEDRREATVLSLLPPPWRDMDLFPVGRLDKDTEGLLLLTNDGELAHRLLSPRRHVDKVYLARVEGTPDQGDREAFRRGVVLKDGTVCLPAELTLTEDPSECYVTLQEGKYHQVKRMLASRGKPVRYLRRERFGPLVLPPGLAPGEWRFLTEEEKTALFRSQP